MQILRKTFGRKACGKKLDTKQAEIYKKLKSAACSALRSYPYKGNVRAGCLRARLKGAMADIAWAKNKAELLSEDGEKLPAAFEWIADNFYLLSEKAAHFKRDLKRHTALQGTFVRKSGETLPRFFAAFSEYIELVDEPLDTKALSAFMSACEKKDGMRPAFADYYSYEMLFSVALIAAVGKICKALRAHPLTQNTGESAAEIARYILSLKELSLYRFEKCFLHSEAERILSTDPAGVYSRMTEETKAYYRRRLARLAAQENKSEITLAAEIIEKANAAEPGKKRHVGEYLYPKVKKLHGCMYFLTLGLLLFIGIFPLLWHSPLFLLAIFPVWETAKFLTDRIFSYILQAPPLPRLSVKELPEDGGVLVVITTLLGGERADSDIFERLERFYLSNGGKNVYFAILGDFSDSPTATMPTDDAILQNAYRRIDALRQKYGEHFYVCMRLRSYSKTQGAFMGYERKRGAVCGLIRYLCGGESPFLEGAYTLPKALCEKIRYVLTLDADTNMPTEAVTDLAGVMMHPLNMPDIDVVRHTVRDGYGICQMRVSPELTAARKTAFSRILAGNGGMEPYAFTQFEVYQNVFGDGIFCGKGMIDKFAFDETVNHPDVAFREDYVLSHDILEGARCRTVFDSTTVFTDGFPKNELSYFKRHHRWVRGDVQNLAFLAGHIQTADGKKVKNNFSPLAKFKIFDNVRRAFVPVFAFFGIVAASFLSPRMAAMLVFLSLSHRILPCFFPLLALFRTLSFDCAARRFFSKGVTSSLWRELLAACLSVAMLPKNAFVTLNAAFRSFWRVVVNSKQLLEWVTAAQSDRTHGMSILDYVEQNLSGAACGAALFIFSPYGIVKFIGLIWFFFPAIAFFVSKETRMEKRVIRPHEKKKLTAYVKDMWRYFEYTVTENDHFLPLDNLQLFPSEIKAHRTSPTNIGLYLASALAARDFELIDSEELYTRLDASLSTIERLDKWKGHLYNWYDTEKLSVLEPKYVSSVDSGNFLACLRCVIEGVKEYAHEKTELIDIAFRAEALFKNTELAPLYDREKRLFTIGVGFENGKAVYSTHFYDMLMSEARTLSYIALARRDVPKEHFAALSRSLVKKGDRVGLASWTGTAFEYFMPALFLPTVKGSLMYEALRFAFYCERLRKVTVKNGFSLWGISESGYFAFDSEMNYRYKAFGVPELGVKRGLEDDLVLSPYSSFLALALDVSLPLDNLYRFAKAGAYGKFAFYEAYDFTPERGGKHGALVKSYMSHHVGMGILAAANAVKEDIFVRRFMADSAMGSAAEFLEEKIPVDAVVRRVHRTEELSDLPERVPNKKHVLCFDLSQHENKRKAFAVSDTRSTILAGADGKIQLYAAKNALNKTDRQGIGGFYTFFETGGEVYSPTLLPFGEAECRSFRYAPGEIAYRFAKDDMDIKTEYRIWDDPSVILVRTRAKLSKAHQVGEPVRFSFCFEPVLMSRTAFDAHPAFHSLFLVCHYDEKNKILVYERRMRENSSHAFLAVGLEDGAASFEFSAKRDTVCQTPFTREDYKALVMGDLDGSTGTCIHPLCLVRHNTHVPQSRMYECSLMMAFSDSRESAVKMITDTRKKDKKACIANAENLATLIRLEAGLMMSEKEDALICDMLSTLLMPRSYEKSAPSAASLSGGQGTLWKCGISGDLPILLVTLPTAKATDTVNVFLKTFVYLRRKRIYFDLVFVFGERERYRRPFESALVERLHKCGASEYLKKNGGGIFLVDQGTNADVTDVLVAYACGIFDGNGCLRAEEQTGISLSEHLSEKIVMHSDNDNAQAFNDTMAPKDVLLQTAGGYFKETGTYVVQKGKMGKHALPQSMVLSGRVLSSILTQNSLGYTFHSNAVLRRITPFHNDPITDMQGEKLLLRQDGVFYDLVALSGMVEYGLGFAKYHGTVRGTPYSVTVYIPEKLPLKVIDVHFDTPVSGSVMLAAEPVMGEKMSDARLCYHTAEEDMVTFKNPFAEYFSEYVGFITAVGGKAKCTAYLGGILDGYAAVEAPASTDMRYALGAYKKDSGMKALLIEELCKDGASLLDSAMRFAASKLPCITLTAQRNSEDAAALSVLFNRYLPYQAGICRMTARSGFYQSGGAYGFRDQLQDALCVMYADKDAAKAQILRAASHQFPEGDALHWWHTRQTHVDPTAIGAEYDRGIRSLCSDDYLWLVFATLEYIRYTGDRAILDKPIRYAESEPLPNGQTERYLLTRRSGIQEPLFDHLVRALTLGFSRIGAKGLALLGSGDWSDGLNRAGERMKGESVWLSMFLKIITEEFCTLCKACDKARIAEPFEEKAKALSEAIKRHGYDTRTGYFLRAWYDDGTPIGMEGNAECEIDLLPQAFSVFSGMDSSMAKSAIAAAYDKLYDKNAKIFKLLSPPFGTTHRDPGYIRGYAPGIRENGGQYTHAAVWGVMAILDAACMGETPDHALLQKGVEAFFALFPPLRCLTEKDFATYKCEPYVLCGDIYSGKHAGRGGWSWYTGSAAWLWRCVLEKFFGITLSKGQNGLTLSFTENAFVVPFVKKELLPYALTVYDKELCVTLKITFAQGEKRALYFGDTAILGNTVTVNGGTHTILVESLGKTTK